MKKYGYVKVKIGKNIINYIKLSLFYVVLFGICYLLKTNNILVNYAWTTLGDYRFWIFYWILSCILVLFQRKIMLYLIEAGCIFSILMAQVIGYISTRKSILQFDDSYIVFPITMISFLLVGIIVELYQKKKFKRLEYFIFLIVFLVNLLSFYYCNSMLQLHKGAERGYLAGYEQGQTDGKAGKKYSSYEDEKESLRQEGFQTGSAEWKGFSQYYSSGYAAGQKDANNSEQELSLSTESIKEDDNVLYVTDREAAIEYIDEYITFLNNDGIIVVIHDSDNPVWLDEMLGMPFSSVASDNMDVKDAGEDIATLYYEYGEGLKGVYIINVGEKTSSDKVFLINEAIAFIRDCQSSVKEEPGLFETPDQDNDTGLPLGAITIAAGQEPKGKLVGHFEIFTVQEYNERDFYTVKSMVTAYPGSSLAKSNQAYEAKYQGEGLVANYATQTSSVMVDRFAPARTATTSTHSMNFGINFKSGNSFDMKYGKETSGNEISVTGSTRETNWAVSIDSSAQKEVFSFESEITFTCPATKSYIDIDLYNAYDIDSWNTAADMIEIVRTIRCHG